MKFGQSVSVIALACTVLALTGFRGGAGRAPCEGDGMSINRTIEHSS